MSYAEMEGIVDLESSGARSARERGVESPRREWRLVERWLVFLFVMSVVTISLLAVTIAALPVR
ncbi:MAG: hypothetical protein WCI96_09155 [Planctomycetota bacterium]